MEDLSFLDLLPFRISPSDFNYPDGKCYDISSDDDAGSQANPAADEVPIPVTGAIPDDVTGADDGAIPDGVTGAIPDAVYKVFYVDCKDRYISYYYEDRFAVAALSEEGYCISDGIRSFVGTKKFIRALKSINVKFLFFADERSKERTF